MGLRYKVVLAYALTTGFWAALMFWYAVRGIKAELTLMMRDNALVEARLIGASLSPNFFQSVSGDVPPGQIARPPMPSVVASEEHGGTADLKTRVRRIANLLGRRVTLIDRNGKVLADSHYDPRRMQSQGNAPEVVLARRRGWGADIRQSEEQGSEVMYVAWADAKRAFFVRLSVPLGQIHSGMMRLQSQLFKAVVLASVWVLVATVWVAYGVTRSLSKVAAVAERIGSGDLRARSDMRGGDEVASLARTINQMASNLETTIGELAQTTAQLQAVLSQMTDGLVAVDGRERVLLMNPAAGRILGLDSEKVGGQFLSSVVSSEELLDVVRKTTQLSKVTSREFTIGPGERNVVHASAAPIQMSGDGGVGAVVVLRDLTEWRRLERLQQEFITNASHELRSPVTAIRSLAEALEMGALEDPETAERFLKEIVAKSRYLSRVVDDIMHLARLEGMVQPLAVIKVGAIVRNVIDRMRPEAERQGVSLELVDASGDSRALGVAENVETALTNLIENALKYAADGRRIQVEVRPCPDEIRIAVIDHGPGITGEARERVFERFYRVDKHRSREIGGTGLGLAIVRQAVEGMGGRVWLEDTPGGGATFVVSIPRAQIDVSIDESEAST
jgi:two-component system phosphate regulon sensor histidine kinase PhoR